MRDLGPLSGIPTLMWAGARLTLSDVFFLFVFSERSDTWLWQRDGSEGAALSEAIAYVCSNAIRDLVAVASKN